ncbi:N-acetyl-D-Glu racemase DgcA [Erythrobacter sp. NE805]|uniref:N-acetyl-D-Glu racemase DgcA n=1 Tax=Erythrobacter sp. NE805 TaxID=3389875 RepID=UPI00396B47F1
MQLEVVRRDWLLKEPFTISRGTMTTADAVIVTLRDGEAVGRGEAYGIIYEGETPDSIMAQVESVRPAIEAGIDRRALRDLLPVGGARCAVDCALWDLEAKRSGRPAWRSAGLAALREVETAFTIGMRSAEEVRATAARFADFPLLKLKVGREDPLATIAAARAGAPSSRFIVDPNQSWSAADVIALADQLAALGVVLLEQPVPVDDDEGLRAYAGPVAICADELVHDRSDLGKAQGKYSHINIKLDKTGGLTEALALADAALAAGYGLMVGCMAGSSLAMAPAHLVAQLCDYVDLDGPLLQAEDWTPAMTYRAGRLAPPEPALWG